jgi:hypothetical protein
LVERQVRFGHRDRVERVGRLSLRQPAPIFPRQYPLHDDHLARRTYQEERLPIAAWLLDHTSELLAAIMDAIKVPGAGLDAGRAPENGQLLLGYPWSRLSRSTMDGPVQGGDRAPDAPCRDADSGERVRLFDVFRGPHFTLLELAGATVTAGDRRLLDDEGHARRAYGDNRLVLVRPDGYVGLVATDREAVSEYLRDLASG